MERLTKCDIDGCLIHPWSFNGINGSYDIWDEELLEKQIDRLAAYEDTGLEPDEIADFMKRWEQAVEIGGMLKKYGIDHIWDIIQAEQDGRLVVLPFMLHSTMLNLSDPENLEVMKDVSLYVAWKSSSGIVFHSPYNCFLQDIEKGYIKADSEEADAALAKEGDSEK